MHCFARIPFAQLCLPTYTGGGRGGQKGGNPWENTDEISKHRPSRFKAKSFGGFVAQKKTYVLERKSKSNWVIYQHQQYRAHLLDIHSGKKE